MPLLLICGPHFDEQGLSILNLTALPPIPSTSELPWREPGPCAAEKPEA